MYEQDGGKHVPRACSRSLLYPHSLATLQNGMLSNSPQSRLTQGHVSYHRLNYNNRPSIAATKLVTVPTDVGNLELDAGKGNGKGKYEDSTGGASKSKTAKVIKETAEEHTTFAYVKTTSSVARRSNSVILPFLIKMQTYSRRQMVLQQRNW